MSQLLLDHRSRGILAIWLHKFERPQNISRERWHKYLHAESASLPFGDLAEICDVISPSVLDALQWPN